MTKVIGDYTAAATIDGATHFLLIQPGNSSTAYKKISRNVLLGVTGQPVDISSTQTIQNKIFDATNLITISDGAFILQDDVDPTKRAHFQLSGITTATTRTYTLPNASSTLADIATAQTFTNKTLTAPVVTGGSIDQSTITVDAIAGHTSSTSGTIYGITVTSGAIGTSGISDGAVTPNKLANGSTRSVVLTSETTTSTSYTDLATVTDTVTVTIGNNGRAMVYVYSFISNSVSGANSFVTFAVSGATTSVAADNRALQFQTYTTNAQGSYSLAFLVTGLSTGSTTFKMKYRVDSGTGTFKNRQISVTPL